jgi:hypothetical protein
MALAGSAVHASAVGNLNLGIVAPMITSGALPDSPSARIDANLPTSPFSGVVSINIRYDGQSFICSGTLVGKRQVVSAGHCVDTDGNGHVIDVSQSFAQSGKDVRVIFNSEAAPGSAGRAIVTASAVSMNANYQGFGNCPAGVNSFCVNDDIAVITLSQDAPATAKIYKTYVGDVGAGQLITMAGYGTSGDGMLGYYVSPDFRIKRSGQNYMDLFDLDDEQNFSAGKQEVWYADFDGNGQDTFCTVYGVCTPVLPNDKEAGIGGGDSGGPSFIYANGEYMLLANNTFSGWFSGQTKGSFGTYFGGILMSGYTDYLLQATGGNITLVSSVPEPASFALVLSSLSLMGALRRRRQRK